MNQDHEPNAHPNETQPEARKEEPKTPDEWQQEADRLENELVGLSIEEIMRRQDDPEYRVARLVAVTNATGVEMTEEKAHQIIQENDNEVSR